MIGNVEIKVNDDVKISHGVVKKVSFEEGMNIYEISYRNSRRGMPLPLKFKRYLLSKVLKRKAGGKLKSIGDLPVVEFTFGKDEESGILAVTIVHERDSFNRKIGRAIVEGRIKRMKGDLEWTDDNGVVHQSPYDPIPKFIEVEESD